MTSPESSYLQPQQPLRLKSGMDYSLEEMANRLLAESRKGITALRDKQDYLTHDQLMLRSQREVLVTDGIPDEAYHRGMFRRVFSPTFGKRPTGGTHHHDDETR